MDLLSHLALTQVFLNHKLHTPTQHMVLIATYLNPGITAKKLKELTKSGSLSCIYHLLDTLRERGFIESRREPTLKFYPTEDGEDLFRQAAATLNAERKRAKALTPQP